MKRENCPTLDFPSIPVTSRETPRSLRRLLYRGLASIPRNEAEAVLTGEVARGAEFMADRCPLVLAIHEFITDRLVAGGSAESARKHIDETVAFFAWAEQSGASLTLELVQVTYINWVECLIHRWRVKKAISHRTAYTSACEVGRVLDGVLGRDKPLVLLTRMTAPRHSKTAQGASAEKQKLQETFQFGRLLQDLCDGLPLSVIWGPLRVKIALREGGSVTPYTGSLPRRAERSENDLRRERERQQAYEADKTLSHAGRRGLVNLRILAELLMFIGQTGMNSSQARHLQLRQFSYSAYDEGYEVRDYKNRRGGEVLFRVFSEYRNHFERYLDWRRALFPHSSQLFPLLQLEGARQICFERIIRSCKEARVAWVPPSLLRGTRVNWLLRRSGDADLTAEQAQHFKKTLLKVYEVPSLHRTITEATRFWRAHDPALATTHPVRAVAPGSCDSNPISVAWKPPEAPGPDCLRPSGCLWCEHHRDIDSFDYVWSIACFRHLKTLELAKHTPAAGLSEGVHPAQHAVDRLTAKLQWFQKSTGKRGAWVGEALARIEEGSYHSQWALMIRGFEGSAS